MSTILRMPRVINVIITYRRILTQLSRSRCLIAVHAAGLEAKGDMAAV